MLSCLCAAKYRKRMCDQNGLWVNFYFGLYCEGEKSQSWQRNKLQALQTEQIAEGSHILFFSILDIFI